MAWGLGPAEMLALLLVSSGTSMDAVSLFPAADYFKMRSIETTPAKLLELATTDPTTPKAQIQQLLALRLLAQSPRLTPEGMRQIEAIASGTKANDKQGFAKLYAQRLLAAATGMRP